MNNPPSYLPKRMPTESRPIYVKNKSDAPSGPHWAIFDPQSVYIPGDERSRTNPGHGYPESTEYYMNYIAYTDEAAWKAEIERRMKPDQYGGPKLNFIAAKVTPATISTHTTVNVA